jgi:hypothetical protein
VVESRPLASLTSSLLARKGAARPAMRRQLAMGDEVHDDLGWNDMGDNSSYQSDPMAVVGLTPMPQAEPPVMRVTEVEAMASSVAVPADVPPPAIFEQRRVLAEKVAEAAMPAAPAPTVITALRKAKAAFTLRLDPERHLRLRLACVIGNRSAQQIVTQALDAFLAGQPEIDALAEQLARDGTEIK